MMGWDDDERGSSQLAWYSAAGAAGARAAERVTDVVRAYSRERREELVQAEAEAPHPPPDAPNRCADDGAEDDADDCEAPAAADGAPGAEAAEGAPDEAADPYVSKKFWYS